MMYGGICTGNLLIEVDGDNNHQNRKVTVTIQETGEIRQKRERNINSYKGSSCEVQNLKAIRAMITKLINEEEEAWNEQCNN